MEPYFAEAIDFVLRCQEQRVEQIPRTLLERLMSTDAISTNCGDRRLSEIRENLAFLDRNGHERSPQQCELQEAMLMASARLIYKGEFDENVERFMNANGWEKLYQEVLIGTPRRFGKTYSTAMLACVLLLALPGVKICIYSTGKSTAAMVLKHIKEFAHQLPCFVDFDVITSNEKVFELAPMANLLDKRIVTSFTSNPKMSCYSSKTRGCINDVVWYLYASILQQGMAPILLYGTHMWILTDTIDSSSRHLQSVLAHGSQSSHHL